MKYFDEITKSIRKHHSAVLKMLATAEVQALNGKHGTLLKSIQREKKKITESLTFLVAKSQALQPVFEKELKKRTLKLEKQVAALSKAKDSLISDNYLLEYKKNDLLLLTSKLEEANEEISKKNQELLLQQEKISEQTEKLNRIHQEILEKHQELEQQKEALLDQSDYLHDANERITMMHHEVEKQKDEILKKNDALLNLNNEKNNLISIVAHDLKSPLNQIKGLLSVMKMTVQPTSETLSYINMIERSTGRLTEMIAKILDVEAIESRNLNLLIEAVNLSPVLTAIVDRFLIIAIQKNIKIHTSFEDVTALVDSGYLEQIFENLISNAIKFSPTDKNIFITSTCVNQKARIEVRDEGPGISTGDKKKLFGKYQKLSAKPTGNETSTGLGLSIVKKYVEAMDGLIWCESEEGSGASFFVAFPTA